MLVPLTGGVDHAHSEQHPLGPVASEDVLDRSASGWLGDHQDVIAGCACERDTNERPI